LSFVKDYFNLFEGQNRPSLLDSAVETTRLRRAPFPLGDKHVEAIDGAQRTRQHHGMKVRDAIKLIESDGWYLARTRGSHRQFKHPKKRGLVTIAGIGPGAAACLTCRKSHRD
jgi:predicted RNA binding protein YcfA (HicA-like mRNA interferase family)